MHNNDYKQCCIIAEDSASGSFDAFPAVDQVPIAIGKLGRTAWLTLPRATGAGNLPASAGTCGHAERSTLHVLRTDDSAMLLVCTFMTTAVKYCSTDAPALYVSSQLSTNTSVTADAVK